MKNRPPSTKQDLDTIKAALEQTLDCALKDVHKDWYERWEQATFALKALRRIKHKLTEKRQMQLL